MGYKYFYGFLLSLIFAGYNAQISDTVKKLAQPLDHISYAESSHIGVGGKESKIYNQFKKVAKIASNDELYYFVMNGSNALKYIQGKNCLKERIKDF